MDFVSLFNSNEVKNMDCKENMIELLTDFIYFLKEKEDEKMEKEVDVIEDEDEIVDDEDDDNFDKTIDKISKGE